MMSASIHPISIHTSPKGGEAKMNKMIHIPDTLFMLSLNSIAENSYRTMLNYYISELNPDCGKHY